MPLPRFRIRTLMMVAALVAISLRMVRSWTIGPPTTVGDMILRLACLAIATAIVLFGLALAFVVLVSIAGLLLEMGERLSLARRRRDPE